MAEKTSQTNSSSNNLPSVPAVAPTSDTPYIQPIIGKLGYDTKHPDIFGIGASPDNGVSFRVFASFDGLVFNDNDIDAIWDNGTSEKVKSEVNSATAEIPAVKLSAEEAVKKADSAISLSKVNSDTLVAQSNAISEAKSSMESSVAEINQAIADANSNAAKIRADVDQVQSEVNNAKSANESTVEQIKSDISQTKDSLTAVNDKLAQAQSAANQAQSALREQVNQLSANVTANQSAITQAQTENDNVAKRLDVYASQASAQGETIKTVQSDVAGNTATIADINSNVTQVQQMADNLSASLKNADSSIASVKAQADNLSATLSNQAKSIASVTATATQIKTSLSDATGRLSTLEQTSSSQSATLSDVQKNLNNVTATATTLTNTLSNAQGIINKLQASAKSTQEQISDLQGNYTALQTTVNGLSTTVSGHDKSIESLQVTANGLTNSVKDAQGNISSLQSTAKTLNSSMTDAQGRLSRVEQTASTLTNEFSDEQGHLNRVEQTAQGTQQTVANQQGQINSIQTDAAGIHETLTGQGNQIANINVTLNGLNSKYEGVSGDLGKLKSQAQWITVTSAVDLNNIKTPCHEFLKGTVTNAPNESAWWYLTVEGSVSGRITQTVIADQSNNRYTRRWADGWSAWVKDATQTDVTALSNRITTNSTQITQNKQAIALKADQSTVNNLSGEVSQAQAQLKVQAGQISSKVSSTDFKTLNDKVNGMKIGGRNLLQGTAKFEFPLNSDGGTQTIQKYDDETNYIQHTSKTLINRMGPWWPLTPEVGQVYTLSADVCGNGYIQGEEFRYEGGDVGSLGQVDLTNDWQRISNTFHVNAINGNWIIYANNSTLLKVKHIKIEKGNVATDWTPAPEDTITAIQKNSTAIDQTKKDISLKANQTDVDTINDKVSHNSSRLDIMNNEIKSKVSSTDVNSIVDSKGYVTTSTVQSLITQKAGKINESITNLTNSFNSLQVGGRNLLHGTSDQWKTLKVNNGNGWLQATTASTCVTSTADYHTGSTFTYAAKITNNSHQQAELEIWLLNQNNSWNGQSFHALIPKGANAYDASVTFPITADTRYIRSWVIFTGGNAPNGDSVQVKDERLVEGNLAMDWTPAPEDMATVMQIQQVTATVDGLQSTVANKADKSQITQLSNVIQSKVSTSDFTSKVSQLSNDINARVQKGDLISQINLEAEQTLIESKKLFLDADSVVFSGKAFIPDAAIENLSLDKLTTGSLKVPLADDNGNAISLDESGITINSALSPVTWIPFYGKSDDQSGFYLSLSSKGMKFVNHFVYGKDTQKQIGAKSDDYTFMDIQPDVLHYRDGSTDNVNIPSGLTIYVPQETSSSLGPASPGGFFAMGYKNFGSALHGQDIKKGVEIAYVSKEINGWLEGFHVETNMFVHPRGADHGIRFAWVSWSAWDFGERYPAIVNDTANWGGVAFPKSGAVTLFNATGKYYTPDKDTGHGTYSDYQ